jgi:putative PIN family toxin of toxin-antitoxin system
MNRKKFIFDTNTFLSAALKAGSVNDLALDRAFKTGTIAISQQTSSELTEVIFRKKFDKYFTDDKRLQILEKFERDTQLFKVDITIFACRDPKDNKFL